MRMKDDKQRKIPLPGDGAYTSRQESGDFRKIENDDDADDDTDDANFMDMPPGAPADGDENYQDEDENRSRQDYREKGMREDTEL